MSSTAKTLISPDEYLAMTFGEREPEYVRGEVVERPMPDYVHSAIQALLVMLLAPLRPQGFRILTEVRTRLAEDNYRLPDVAVFGPEHAPELVPSAAPLVAVEIVSKDERYSVLLEKLEDYAVWGVRHIWVVDPMRRRLSVYTSDGLRNVVSLRFEGVEVRMDELLRDIPADLL